MDITGPILQSEAHILYQISLKQFNSLGGSVTFWQSILAFMILVYMAH